MRSSPPLLDPASHPGVVLSFDDGPSAVTAPLLDVLGELSVPAVFFVTASLVSGREELLRRMVAEGHTVASHGWDHVDLSALHPVSQLSQLRRASEVIASVSGVAPRFFRAPYGRMDASLHALASSAGMQVLDWSLEAGDWEDLPPEVLASRIAVPAAPGDVALLHDGRKPHLRPAGVVSALVPLLRSRGLELVPL